MAYIPKLFIRVSDVKPGMWIAQRGMKAFPMLITNSYPALASQDVGKWILDSNGYGMVFDSSEEVCLVERIPLSKESS